MRTNQLTIEILIFVVLILPSMALGTRHNMDWKRRAIDIAREHVDKELSDFFFNETIEEFGPNRREYYIRLKIGDDYKADTVWLDSLVDVLELTKNDSILMDAIKEIQFDSVYFTDKSVLDSVFFYYHDSNDNPSARLIARCHVADTLFIQILKSKKLNFEGPGRIRYLIRFKIGTDYKPDTVWLDRIKSYEKNDSILMDAIKTVQFDSAYFKAESVNGMIYYVRLEFNWGRIPEEYLDSWNPDPYH